MRWLALALAVGCTDMPRPKSNPLAPWHMWGSSQQMTVEAPAGTGAGSILNANSVQLFRINYKRPETWSFWLSAELMGGNVSDVDIQVITEFNLIVGAGRTVFDTQGTFGTDAGFATFRWLVVAGVSPGQPPRKKWTTQFETPTLDEVTGASTRKPIEWVPAQDLQCRARSALILTGATAVDNQVLLNVTSWAAPRAHVRPEWFDGEYTGAEKGGT